MAEKTVREQMAAALEEMVPLLKHAERFFKYQRPGHEFSPAREDVDACLDRSALALVRHRAEPEHKCSLRACGFGCPCYREGRDEGLEAQRDRVGRVRA